MGDMFRIGATVAGPGFCGQIESIYGTSVRIRCGTRRVVTRRSHELRIATWFDIAGGGTSDQDEIPDELMCDGVVLPSVASILKSAIGWDGPFFISIARGESVRLSWFNRDPDALVREVRVFWHRSLPGKRFRVRVVTLDAVVRLESDADELEEVVAAGMVSAAESVVMRSVCDGQDQA